MRRLAAAAVATALALGPTAAAPLALAGGGGASSPRVTTEQTSPRDGRGPLETIADLARGALFGLGALAGTIAGTPLPDDTFAAWTAWGYVPAVAALAAVAALISLLRVG
jgi:hypothetical protein